MLLLPLTKLWEGYVSDLVPHVHWKLDAYVRWSMLENAYDEYLESRTSRFAYDVGKVFKQLCEELASGSEAGKRVIEKGLCACKKGRILEDVWRLFGMRKKEEYTELFDQQVQRLQQNSGTLKGYYGGTMRRGNSIS
jgi:hypothetical protein